MTNHKIVKKDVAISFGEFRQEVALIECGKTNKLFQVIVSYDFNKELNRFNDPRYNYSYCPHCAERLDFKE